jgi:hypothetical protein
MAMCVALGLPMAMAQQVKGDRVGGRVVSDLDGHPLGGAVLTLTTVSLDAAAQVVVATTRADEGGHFQFEPVPAGKYSLTGAAKHYLATEYMQHETYWTALVTGAGLATDALELRLWPAADISGRVVEDSGEAVNGANVGLFYEDLSATPKVKRIRAAIADDEGNYVFDGLQRGRYYLSAVATPWYAVHPAGDREGEPIAFREAIDPALDVAYPMTFYADATSSDGAAALTVAGGEHLNADLHLHAQPAMTLTVHLAEGQAPQETLLQLSQRVFGVEEASAGMVAQGQGDARTIRMIGIAPGRYEVDEGGRESARLGVVDLSDGSATMEIPKAALVEVTVTLHGMPGDSLQGAGVGLRSDAGTLNTGFGLPVTEKGVAVFHVPAGEYRFNAFARGSQFGTMGVTVDGKRSANGSVQVTHSVAVELNVAQVKAAVEGFARRRGAAGAGSMVVLVPAGGDTSDELFRRDQSDLDGSFVFHDVVPGHYIVVAIDDGWGLQWTDIKAMAPYLMKGLPVSIGEGGAGEVKLAAGVDTQAR